MKVKRTINCLVSLLLIALTFTITSTQIFAQDSKYEENQIIIEAPDYYSEENIKAREKTASAFALVPIEQPSSKTLNIIGYKQLNSDYCAPASVKIVLQYLNGTSSSQSTYATNMGTNSDGTIVYRVVNELNRVEGSGTYMYSLVDDLDLAYGTKYSIDLNHPVIYNPLTTSLPGYSGNSGSGHYVVGYKYNYYLDSSNRMQYKISYWDPYDNGGTSYGAHTVTKSTLKTAINDNTGYYILKAE